MWLHAQGSSKGQAAAAARGAEAEVEAAAASDSLQVSRVFMQQEIIVAALQHCIQPAGLPLYRKHTQAFTTAAGVL